MSSRIKAGPLLVAAALALAPGPAVASDQPAEVDAVAAMTDQERTALIHDLDMLKTADVAALTPDEALEAGHIGKRVRWAGAVYDIDGGCLTILLARSGDYGEPRWTLEPTYQTFVGCAAGTYDAELVHTHTNVTIIGRVTGKQFIGMGGGGSDGPTVQIEKLYRWSDCLVGDDSPVCKQGFLTAAPDVEE